jgi:hypothetical protein
VDGRTKVGDKLDKLEEEIYAIRREVTIYK